MKGTLHVVSFSTCVRQPDKHDSIHRDRMVSIRMFLQRLNVFTVREAMEIACARKYSPNPGFKYFCGICWNKIKDGET